MGFIVSTDTGGTFVDAVIMDPASGEMGIGKASSTPDKPSIGMIEAIRAAAQTLGVPLELVFAGCEIYFNGTTVTTNAMIQRSGAKTGLLITKGFEDTLLIGRVKARTVGLSEREVTNYQRAEKPLPIVPISLTRGVAERVDYRGTVLGPLDLKEVEDKVGELVQQGIEALAVCLLWSFKNPVHEQMIKAFVRERWPWLYLTVSSDLVPMLGEYERANTTAINCFLGPVLDGYVAGTQTALAEMAYQREFLVMQSVGGLAPAHEIRSSPITTLYSGPVGGVIASLRLGNLLGDKNIITADMGGTSFDVSLIADGVPQVNATTVIQRQTVMFPAIDLVTIGAGGGSVAWLDSTLTLRVGPQSMGSTPGPACYGLGGSQPTVTDADVVLGYLNPQYFLGGSLTLQTELAQMAIENDVSKPMSVSREEAALGIYTIVNAHMADLIRKVSVERGHDPRQFSLYCFGGCGPAHCTAFGPEMGIKKLVIPHAATVFSALGIAQSDLKHSYAKSCLMLVAQGTDVDDSQLSTVNEVFEELQELARDQLKRDEIDAKAAVLLSSIDIRYKDQVNEVAVPITWSRTIDATAFRRLVADFQQRYQMLYGVGSCSSKASIELVNFRIDVLSPTTCSYTPKHYKAVGIDPSAALVGSRKVYWQSWNGYVNSPVYRGEKLGPGNIVVGPAILETYGSTLVLQPEQELVVDELLNFVVEMK